MKFNITINDETVIKKLVSMKRHKGEYITGLVEQDIKFEELERRVKELEGK